MTHRTRYNSSSDEDFVPTGGEEGPKPSKENMSCKRRRKQPERRWKQMEPLIWFRWATWFANRYRPAVERMRVETRGEPPTQVLPEETWLDVFTCDDRETLECLQLACGRFDRIVKTKMKGVCLR
ncbi:hypothetical protein AAVH_42328, partial [Aphelenchoides avenae]